MHTIRYKGHIAQQDKTGVVLVYKNGELVLLQPRDRMLSGKELRTEINMYINGAQEVGSDEDKRHCEGL